MRGTGSTTQRKYSGCENGMDDDQLPDEELLSAFEECSLPYDDWNHRAHVRVAWMYADRHDLPAALTCIRDGIKKYNKATDTPEAIDRGYHETITRAFMTLVFHANTRTRPHRSSSDFCNAHPELLSKHLLRHYYSRERIMSWQAKSQFVEPDRQELN